MGNAIYSSWEQFQKQRWLLLRKQFHLFLLFFFIFSKRPIHTCILLNIFTKTSGITQNKWRRKPFWSNGRVTKKNIKKLEWCIFFHISLRRKFVKVPLMKGSFKTIFYIRAWNLNQVQPQIIYQQKNYFVFQIKNLKLNCVAINYSFQNFFQKSRF